jgi:hypothetical protein
VHAPGSSFAHPVYVPDRAREAVEPDRERARVLWTGRVLPCPRPRVGAPVILVEGPFGIDMRVVTRALESRTRGIVVPGAEPPVVAPDGPRPGLLARAAEVNTRMRTARRRADDGTTVVVTHGMLALAVDYVARAPGRRPSLADSLRRLRADTLAPDLTLHLEITASNLRERWAAAGDPALATLMERSQGADRIVRAHRLWRARDAQAVAVLDLDDAPDLVADRLIEDLLRAHDLAAVCDAVAGTAR